jgi:vancomycin permeability regulator SanA
MKKYLSVFLKTSLLTGILLVIAVSSGYWGSNFSEKPLYFSEKRQVCGVIFGAAVWREDKPSHALYDRTMTGIDLYRSGKLDCLLFSGGNSLYGAHEVDVMQNMAIESGIKKTDIFLDYEGHNTLRTIQNLKNFPTLKNAHVVLITNDFHLFRTRYFFRRYANTGEGLSVQKAWQWHGRYAKEPYFFMREVIALVYYGWRDVFGVWVIIFVWIISKKRREKWGHQCRKRVQNIKWPKGLPKFSRLFTRKR